MALSLLLFLLEAHVPLAFLHPHASPGATYLSLGSCFPKSWSVCLQQNDSVSGVLRPKSAYQGGCAGLADSVLVNS